MLRFYLCVFQVKNCDGSKSLQLLVDDEKNMAALRNNCGNFPKCLYRDERKRF